MSSIDTLVLPSPLKLGWIGTGVMGEAMCHHVLDASYAITVHSRTKHKAEPLLAKGARWASSPAQVLDHADVVFTMVGFPQDVRAVYFGEWGLLPALRWKSMKSAKETKPILLMRRSLVEMSGPSREPCPL